MRAGWGRGSGVFISQQAVAKTALILMAALGAVVARRAELMFAAVALIVPASLTVLPSRRELEFVATANILPEEAHHRLPFPAVWSGPVAMQQPGHHMRHLVWHCLGEKVICLQDCDLQIVTNHQAAICLMPYLAGTLAAQVATDIKLRKFAAAAMEQGGRTLKPLIGGPHQLFAECLSHAALIRVRACRAIRSGSRPGLPQKRGRWYRRCPGLRGARPFHPWP